MARLLSRLVLSLTAAALVWSPAGVSRADEPSPTAPALSSSNGADPALSAGLERDPDLGAVLDEVRSELAESSEAMLLAAADLRLADRALPGARETVRSTRSLLRSAQERQERIARQRGSAQQQLMLSTVDAEESAAAVVEQQARIGALARTLYQGGASFSEVSVLLDSRSPVDFASRLVSLKAVASAQSSTLADMQAVRDAYDARTADLETVRDRFASADLEAQRVLREITELSDQARRAEEQVSALVARRRAALATAAAAQAEEEAANRRRAGETSRLQSQLAAQAQTELGAAGGADGARVPGRPGTLAWPVIGRISSQFGMRVHPITGVYKLHTGTDLGVACDTPIRAALPGRVVQAGWDPAYGWRTVVSHGNVGGVLLTTTYNHQSQLLADIGRQVALGEVIGAVGSTGYSTGCHLHFELYVNSAFVDAENWLPPH